MEDELSAESSFRAFEDYNGCLQISMKPSKRQPPEAQHRIQGVLISSDTENLILTPCPARVRAMTRQIEKHLDTDNPYTRRSSEDGRQVQFPHGAPFRQGRTSPSQGDLRQSQFFLLSARQTHAVLSDGTSRYYPTLPADDHPTEPDLPFVECDLHRRLL